MKRSFFLASALLVTATGIQSWNDAYAAEVKPAEQQRCFANNPDGPPNPESLSAPRTTTQAMKAFHYVGQPELQEQKSRLGSTPDEIHTNFAGVIENNFQYGSAEHLLGNLSERELTDLAALYTMRTQGETRPLLRIFAQRLSDQELVRVAKTFGAEQVSAAVNAYAAPNIRSSFNAKIAAINSPNEVAKPLSDLATPMAAPTLDMTLNEIYLEFRTAPIGSVGPTAAIAETTAYSGIWLTLAWKTGTGLGNELNGLINTYDPSLGDAIGGTVADMVDATNQSWSELQQGQYQASFDALFGYPISNSGNPAGDFDEFQPMDFYWGATGCL